VAPAPADESQVVAIEADAGTAALAPFRVRLRQRALDPSVLANPPTAAAFCLLRAYGLIAPLPYWLLVTIVFAAGSVSVLSATLFGNEARRWYIPAYAFVSCGIITVVTFTTGWGPILSIGFIFGAGASIQLFGSKAVRWTMACTVLWMGLAQAAIALRIAPTLIRQPLVHGLAALSLLGTVLTIALLGRVTADREKAAASLSKSERRFKALVSNSSDIIIVTDPAGRLQYVSPSFERQLGISPLPYFEEPAAAFIHPDDLTRISAEMGRVASHQGEMFRTQLRIQNSRGDWRHFEATITNRMDDPDVLGTVGNLHDITDLLEAHERFRSAFDDAPIGIALTTLDGVILRANRAYGIILGLTADALVGRRVAEFVHQDDLMPVEDEHRRIEREESDGYEIERRLCHALGHEVWAMVHVSCVRDSMGKPRYLVEQIQDVTEQRTMREHLAHAAIHDPLTGLPNRVLFMDRLTVALDRAARLDRQVAVAFLDLDRFKLVNDGLGHSVGDELLRAVAIRLAGALRAGDTVARFGGDEFTILWEGLAEEGEAVAVAERMLEELQQPFELDGTPVYVSASVGVVIADAEATPVSMLRDADSAMYLAKGAGRSRVEIFDGTSHALALENLHVINQLHASLATNEFRLHYQPIVDLASDEIVAVEALARWQHPKRGLLGPDQFVPVAEECGLIVPLGAWVLQESCAQVARWNEAGVAAGLAPIEVNVNISPRQLSSPDFVASVRAALVVSALDPALLCLEITESTLMQDARASADTLEAVRELGVRISVDDFGTGYSSLSYLKHFPIDALKVDRSFVDGLGEESDDSAIVSAVIALAHSLGITAVAEGVETEIALEELRRLDCDRVQGFLLGHPQPPRDLQPVLFDRAVRSASTLLSSGA